MLVIYLYCVFLTKRLNELVEGLPIVSDKQRYTEAQFGTLLSNSSLTWPTYTDRLDMVLGQAQRIADGRSEFLFCATILAGCACLSFFKTFGASMQVNMMAQAMLKACGQLLHYLVVVIVALMMFVLTGYMLWGGRLEAFHTLGHALESTLLFVSGFFFNSVEQEMWETGGVLGMIWVWLFFVITVILLLNMAVIIILDAYIDGKAKAGPGASLLRQSPDMTRWQRWRLSRLGNRAYSLLAAKGAHPAPFVSSTSLVELLGVDSPLGRLQVDSLLAGASAPLGRSLDGSKTSVNDQTSFVDAVRLCGRIDANVEHLGGQLHELAAVVNEQVDKLKPKPKNVKNNVPAPVSAWQIEESEELTLDVVAVASPTTHPVCFMMKSHLFYLDAVDELPGCVSYGDGLEDEYEMTPLAAMPPLPSMPLEPRPKMADPAHTPAPQPTLPPVKKAFALAPAPVPAKKAMAKQAPVAPPAVAAMPAYANAMVTKLPLVRDPAPPQRSPPSAPVTAWQQLPQVSSARSQTRPELESAKSSARLAETIANLERGLQPVSVISPRGAKAPVFEEPSGVERAIDNLHNRIQIFQQRL